MHTLGATVLLHRTTLAIISLSVFWMAGYGWSQEIDESPLPVKPVLAFPKLKFSGWQPDDNGRPTPLRPILLTHPGDGSHRLVVPQQQGQIHIFSNRPDVTSTTIFLDLSSQVVYKDSENEEGLLGLAFHPRYKENGEFFVYYTTTTAPHTSVISRFKVSRDDPYRADPQSEEELLRLPQPFWNHNGGTLCFGPDGYLYIGLGDGGSANDPFHHAQNLQSLLGKILRIDVDHQDPGLKYAIPADNPFVNVTAPTLPGEKRPLIAKPEIWAYGVRNIWRMAFDRQTGALWAADVGQNLWEEINIIEKGGNYGWNLREGRHVFSPAGSGIHSNLIEPIWEYYHDVGKSITGGVVYRGQRLPALQGYYLYADYVSGRLWGLKYDEQQRRVVANRPILYEGPPLPIISFGEDEAGEVYFTVVTATGEGIYTFAPR
ncbi:MAG: protein up-regulated by thyroid hormone-PQQ-dependent glucose dehydrogenase [Planctomycetaceae bacterium]|nr:MAG: protein up-regulated by thyroid hormone-PQQ-dependent glucose dehydrogenase [Planctomycetaceae bacterium]